MTKRYIAALAFLFISASSYAQGEMDVYKLSKNDLTGTARTMSMGGVSMAGLWGGNTAGIAMNPAVIGAYKTSEIVGTFNFQNTGTEALLNAGKTNLNDFKFTMDNMAYVGAFRIGASDDPVPFLNFGIQYNRLKSFDRKYRMKGNDLSNSITDYMAKRAGTESPATFDNSGSDNPFTSGADWLPVLGYNAGLIGTTNANAWTSLADSYSRTVNSDLNVREKGSVSSYDFSMGATVSNKLNFGITLSVTDMNYYQYSTYDETYSADDYSSLGNEKSSNGSGYQVTAGLIYSPVKALKIGVAYHSPTWYSMTDHYSADMEYDVHKILSTSPAGGYNTASDAYVNGGYINSADTYNAGDTYNDYNMRTPDKWTFSLAGSIGNVAALSVDYELTNYGMMNLTTVDGNEYANNELIRKDFRTASTLHLGAEICITPKFTGRVGYAWMQSPFTSSLKDGNEPPTTTITQYTVDGDVNYFTYGLGYVFNRHFYTDIAFVMRSQKDDLYSFASADKGSLKTTSFQGLMTFGFRF